MFYRIEELATQEPHGLTFVLVHYWPSQAAHDRGEPPTRINDFLMQLPSAQVTQVVTDGEFLVTLGGARVHPLDIIGIEQWQTEIVTVDRRALIRENVEEYWWLAEEKQFPHDHTDRHIKRSRRDPKGVVAEAESMVGEGRLVR